jgi:hypothetical protein
MTLRGLAAGVTAPCGPQRVEFDAGEGGSPFAVVAAPSVLVCDLIKGAVECSGEGRAASGSPVPPALQVIEDGCTTGELARRIGSPPANTLREAGLIATIRLANTVIHTLHPLGACLTKSGPMPLAALRM